MFPNSHYYIRITYDNNKSYLDLILLLYWLEFFR